MIDFLAFFAAAAVLALLLYAGWWVIAGPARSGGRLALRAAVVVAGGLLVAGTAAWKLSNARRFQLAGEIVPRVETRDSLIALTFDDGPFPGPTEHVLGVLHEHGARATFFLVGEAVDRNPATVRRIADAGHEIGNHSYTHPMLLGLSTARMRAEIERTDEGIRRAGYSGPIHFRSPYGKKLLGLPLYLARSDRLNVFWDVEPDSDPEIARDSARVVEHVLERARPGSIILLHVMTEHYAASRAAVPVILKELSARGYRFVTVSELLTAETAQRR